MIQGSIIFLTDNVLHVHKDRCDSSVLADCLNIQFVCGSEHRLSLAIWHASFETHSSIILVIIKSKRTGEDLGWGGPGGRDPPPPPPPFLYERMT